MANRPVFIPHYRAPFFRAVDVSFVYNKGLSVTQKQKNIRASRIITVRSIIGPRNRIIRITITTTGGRNTIPRRLQAC